MWRILALIGAHRHFVCETFGQYKGHNIWDLFRGVVHCKTLIYYGIFCTPTGMKNVDLHGGGGMKSFGLYRGVNKISILSHLNSPYSQIRHYRQGRYWLLLKELNQDMSKILHVNKCEFFLWDQNIKGNLCQETHFDAIYQMSWFVNI